MRYLPHLLGVILTSAYALGQQAPLPGAQRELRQAVEESQSICIARFVSLGQNDIGPLGSFYYSSAELQQTRPLAGKKIALPKFKAGYPVRSFPPTAVEALPVIGVEYILIGQATSEGMSVTKMLTATPENIQEVLRLASELHKVGDTSMRAEGISDSRPQRQNNTGAGQFAKEDSSGTPMVVATPPPHTRGDAGNRRVILLVIIGFLSAAVALVLKRRLRRGTDRG
jgi:hypothetical protein